MVLGLSKDFGIFYENIHSSVYSLFHDIRNVKMIRKLEKDCSFLDSSAMIMTAKDEQLILYNTLRNIKPHKTIFTSSTNIK